jgi:hypothetical protein
MNERPRVVRLRLASLAFAAVTGMFAAMVARHGSAQPVVGHLSIPALAALAISASACIASLAVLVMPHQTALRFLTWFTEGVAAFQTATPRGSTATALTLLILSIISYVVVAHRFAMRNDMPLDDQHDYLRVANEIRVMGGVPELWKRLWTGEYLEANRHPLYTAVLSWRPEFEWGKQLSWVLGLAAIVTVWGVTWRRSGGWIAGGSAVLLATNSVLQQSASLVACEAMLILWTLLAWAAIEGLVRTAPTSSKSVAAFCVYSVAIGCCLGLGYLTKASALFLLAGFWFWSLWIAGVRNWSWLALVSFAVVGTPLFARNARAYGDPLYSFNNRFLFADSFDEGVSRGYHGIRVEAADYWRTHSAGQIARRALNGLVWETFILLRGLGPATLSSSRPLVGFLILVLAGLGASSVDRRLAMAAAAWFVPLWLFFAWYVPIAAGDRFLAPIIPIILIFAARGAVGLVHLNCSGNEGRFGRRMMGSAALWCMMMTILSFREQ